MTLKGRLGNHNFFNISTHFNIFDTRGATTEVRMGANNAGKKPPFCNAFFLSFSLLLFFLSSFNSFLYFFSFLFCITPSGTFPCKMLWAHSDKQVNRCLSAPFSKMMVVVLSPSDNAFKTCLYFCRDMFTLLPP